MNHDAGVPIRLIIDRTDRGGIDTMQLRHLHSPHTHTHTLTSLPLDCKQSS